MPSAKRGKARRMGNATTAMLRARLSCELRTAFEVRVSAAGSVAVLVARCLQRRSAGHKRGSLGSTHMIFFVGRRSAASRVTSDYQSTSASRRRTPRPGVVAGSLRNLVSSGQKAGLVLVSSTLQTVTFFGCCGHFNVTVWRERRAKLGPSGILRARAQGW